LALAGKHGSGHAAEKTRAPRGSRSSRVILAALSGLFCATWLTGCDDGNADQDSARAQLRAEAILVEAESSPLLPAAPWFQLPKDWSEQHPILSPNAKPEAHWAALAEREVEIDPGDGGGRVWLESVESVLPLRPQFDWRRDSSKTTRPELTSSSYHRFSLGFEVGGEGIREGGVISISPEAFWFWSDAQTLDPQGLGYTTAATPAPGVSIEPYGNAGFFTVAGRDLVAGERIEFVYGAGPRGAKVDRYAERGSEIMVAVDADGDGYRRWLPEGVRVDISAGPIHALLAHGPAQIAPGEPFDIRIALVDRYGNLANWPWSVQQYAAIEGPAGTPKTLAASAPPAFRINVLSSGSLGLTELPQRALVTGSNHDSRSLRLNAAEGEGTIRLRIVGQDELEGLSFDLPPIVVRASKSRLVWGDLHGHSQLADGTGTPEDYFRYARDVARLDVVALTEHDHWGPRPLDEQPDVAARLTATANSWNDPGHFVTIPGYEWTSWLHGHRHVLHFGEAAPIYSSLDPETDRPDELWAALRGQPALTFAHHSAGEPIAVNWFYPPDPELEPLTEITSVHGMSEAEDAPVPVRGGIPGQFVRDALLHGYRLGFIGSGDSHDGHPGLAQIASGQGGLAGIFTQALNREDLLSALRRRHTFATNGIRPWLDVSIDDIPMGGTLPPLAETPDNLGPPDSTLRIHYEGTAPIAKVELIRSGRIATLEPDSSMSFTLSRKIPRLDPLEFHYIRIHQTDGGMAWSSPLFAD
jgi:hypothetical protein